MKRGTKNRRGKCQGKPRRLLSLSTEPHPSQSFNVDFLLLTALDGPRNNPPTRRIPHHKLGDPRRVDVVSAWLMVCFENKLESS